MVSGVSRRASFSEEAAMRLCRPVVVAVVFFCFAIPKCISQEAKSLPAAAVDLHGDPLPPGAVTRLGTVRFRRSAERTADCAYLPDNRNVVTASGHEVHFW